EGVRHDDQRAVEAAELHVRVVEQQRHEQAGEEGQGDGEEREDERPGGDLHEGAGVGRVGEDLREVGQADVDAPAGEEFLAGLGGETAGAVGGVDGAVGGDHGVLHLVVTHRRDVGGGGARVVGAHDVTVRGQHADVEDLLLAGHGVLHGEDLVADDGGDPSVLDGGLDGGQFLAGGSCEYPVGVVKHGEAEAVVSGDDGDGAGRGVGNGLVVLELDRRDGVVLGGVV